MAYKEIFTKYLSGLGLKLTKPREIILEAVFANHSHFDAEELYQMIKKDNKSLSIATVYRTLPYLLGSGLVRKAFRVGDKDRYEHVYGHKQHLHFVCAKCGNIVEYADDRLDSLIMGLAKHNGYQIRDYNLVINGVCTVCQEDVN